MTASEVFTDVRGAISDESSVRWSNTVLYRYAFDGELEIVRRHPEAQCHTYLTHSVPALLTALTDSFTIAYTFRVALVHYIAFRVFSEDADDAANQRLAMEHFKLFTEAMA